MDSIFHSRFVFMMQAKFPSNLWNYFYSILILIICNSSVDAKELFGAFSSYHHDGRSIIVTTEQGQRLRLTPYGDFIVRVQAARSKEDFFPDDRYEMVESHQWQGALSAVEDSQEVVMTIGKPTTFSIKIKKESVRLEFVDEENKKILLSQKDGIWWNGDTIQSSFTADQSEHFTGLGHGYFGRELKLDLRGEVVHRNYGTQHGQQAPLIVPFYLSSKGYGIFLNSTFPNTFNFGNEGKYEFSIEGDGRMDYFVILGPDFRDILDRYTQLTGRPRFFPESALGLALSD